MFFATRNRGKQAENGAPGAGELENRAYTRFSLNARATIRTESFTIAGELVDMSLSGAFIGTRSAHRIPMRETVTVTIFDSASPGLLNSLKARVIRITESGCAVRFQNMLLESRGVERYH